MSVKSQPICDLADIFARDICSIDTQFRNFSGKTQISDAVHTSQYFQDNLLLKQTLQILPKRTR